MTTPLPDAIEVYCDLEACAEARICRLAAVYIGDAGLRWAPDYGPTVEVQEVGRYRRRYNVRCGSCGDNETIGEMLGSGMNTPDDFGYEDSQPAHDRLTLLSRQGVSRLPLSSLRRILRMS